MANGLNQLKKYAKQSHLANTLFYLWRLKLSPLMEKKVSPPEILSPGSEQAFPVRAAFICDEMTWKTFAPLCKQAVFVPSECWREVLDSFQPDILFCESAWHGIEGYSESWRSRIFRNHLVWFDNRRPLLDILEYCSTNQIKTVFWNKEDPTYFEHPPCDFVDTALKFDYVFTTAQECVEQYQQRGHRHVALLPFGFSPELFHPLGRDAVEKRAVFCGSWFSDHPMRCQDMEQLFSWVKQKGLQLEIYDRQKQNGMSSFPKKYHDCVYDAVPYETLGDIYRHNAAGVNINTVTDSPTMFARRVLEMMACGLPVISNASVGLRTRFGSKVCMPGYGSEEIPDGQSIHALVREVFLHDTLDKRMEHILKTMGLWNKASQPSLDVYCIGTQAERLFEQIEWQNKQLIQVNEEAEALALAEHGTGDYILVLKEDSPWPDVAFWMTQFAFLPEGCAVGYGEHSYQIEQTEQLADVLWPNAAIRNRTACRQKYNS